jgi:negative regulator of flagellin synthesis FlgM
MDIDRIGQQPAARPANTDAVGEQAAVRQAERARQPASGASTEKGAPAYTVDISERARELARAFQAVDEAPDVRADKVTELQKQIEDGTYQVPAEALARKLLQSDALK